jgi:nucleoredoxin
MVRKRNLSHSSSYRFRVRARDKVDWLPFQTSSLLNTLPTSVQRMAAPREEVGGAAGCVTLSWEPVEEAAAYAVHMREQGAVRWKEVGRVGGTSVKKKNLEAGKAYHFRIRPVGERVEDVWVWSPWTEAMSPPSLPPVLRRMFGSRLAVGGGKESKREIGVESLAGSVVGVYASAHWCAPCRQFTPQLANFYRGLRGAGKAFEIVFVSLDQEKEAFELYFESMPWLAIPWEGGEGEREELMRMYQITSVPRLLIFGRDGELLENNAVGPQFLREEAFHSWWEGRPFRAGGGGCCGGGGCK